MVVLGGGHGLGGGDAFALSGLQLQLDSSFFRVASELAGRGGWRNREDAEGATGEHGWPAELAMVESRGEGRRDVDGVLEDVLNVVGSYGEGVGG